MEINKASIRQESKARIGGWEERCLRLCPNPEMPEKTPGATSSLEVGCFPQPPLACADQAWSKTGSHAIPTYSSSRQPGLLHRPQFPLPSHTYKKEGVWALGPSIPFPVREKGLQSVDLSPAGMASDAVAPLQAQQRQFSPPFNFGNSVFLFIPFWARKEQ